MKRLTIAVDARPAIWSRTGIGTITYNFIRLISNIDSNNDYVFYGDGPAETLGDVIDLHSWRAAPITNRLLWANSFVPRQTKIDRADIFLSFLEKDIPFRGLQ